MTPGGWFAVAVLIFAIIILIVSIVNAVFYNRIRLAPPITSAVAGVTVPITTDTANVLFWVNVVIAVLALIAVAGAGYMIYYLNQPILPVAAAVVRPVAIPAPVLASPPIYAPTSVVNSNCPTCRNTVPTNSLFNETTPLMFN